jgi:hypothetical protein
MAVSAQVEAPSRSTSPTPDRSAIEQSVRPSAAVGEGVTRRKGDASAAGAAPLRSDGGFFLAAAGRAWLGLWRAERLARGCGGLICWGQTQFARTNQGCPG